MSIEFPCRPASLARCLLIAAGTALAWPGSQAGGSAASSGALTLAVPPVHVVANNAVLGAVLALAAPLAILMAQRAWRAQRQNEALRREVEALRVSERQFAAIRDDLEMRLETRAAELVQAHQDLRAEISERERFAMALRASEERYHGLFGSANDLVYEHDLEGRFLAMNKAAQRITGYARPEVMELNIGQLVAPEDVAVVRDMIARQLAGEPASTYEVTLVTKNGARVALELSTHLVFDAGNPVAVQGIARDVTERRRLEEQLRQSQKMEAIGRLAGGLAHDFNNLLTVIGAYSQMILDEIEGHADLKGYAAEVLAATERAAALTSRLLTFSRRQFIQPQVLNLNELVSSMENMLRRLLGEDIELHLELDAALRPIKADPGQIEQVLMNLAVNARDAMPRGGRLGIETARAEVEPNAPAAVAPGDYVTLAVRDTGVGMSPEVMSHIFEPFFTTKEPGKGTGLGLSTVYGIVKQSGGEIAVESEPGTGTAFTIYLEPSSEEMPPAKVPDGAGEGPAPARDRTTILLIEDEPGVRRLVRRMLVERGYRVLEAASGEDALAVFERHHPMVDLLLTDVVMPNMSGAEVAHRLLRLRPGLKVLYMTGYSHDIAIEHGAGGEAAHILRKPFMAEALERKLRELLDERA